MPGDPRASYIGEAVGWSQWDQPADTLWYEVPAGDSIQDHVDPAQVEGIWVHAYNADTPADEHWFWVRSYLILESWDDWDDLIWIAMDQHNMAMA